MKYLIFLTLVIGSTLSASADLAWVNNASIVRTLVQDDKFGGCMVFLNKDIADAGLNCPSRWLSFSCDGTYSSKIGAARLYDSAVMAFALKKKVSIFVDDLKKHNGFCFAKRIDVVN